MALFSAPYRLYLTGPWAGARAVDAGPSEDGFHLELERLGKPITYDELGETVVNGVEQGISVQFEMVALEWQQELLTTLLYPYVDAAGNIGIGLQGVTEAGRLWTERAVKAVLQPIRLPDFKYTFWKCRCLEPMELLYSGRLPKKIPFRMQALPDLSKPGYEFMQRLAATGRRS